MTTLLKKPLLKKQRRASRRARLETTASTRKSAPVRFDHEPPIAPPTCLTDRDGDAPLSEEEYIEALEWLQACIRSIKITDKEPFTKGAQ